MNNASELSRLQHWFLTVMGAAGGLPQGAELAQQRYGYALDEVVASDAGASAQRRMQVYADGYVQRLQECLQTDYPVLRKVMGADLFDFFARAYIWQQPSGSPTLYDLGAGFAGFLLHSQRHARPEMAQMLLLPVELARLERAYSTTMRAPGLEHLPASAEHNPLLATDLRYVCAPCLSLLQLAFPLLPYWQSISQQAEIPAPPAAATSYIAVTRRHYRVQMLELERWQYTLLYALLTAETPAAPEAMQNAIAQSAAVNAISMDQLRLQLLLWLPQAQHLGLVFRHTDSC
jgi:hypothetical protein